MSDTSLSKAVRSNLLSLQSTATMMAKTQERLATGNKVNSALDNPSNFFTASSLNSRAGDLNSLIDGMANGVKTLEAADNGLSSITKTLESMQSTLRQARQDKSFQVASFDVTADSVLEIDGGTLASDIQVKLGAADAGEKASVSTSINFAGPSAAAFADTTNETDAALAGAGARTVLAFDDIATDLAGKTITVDDTEVTFVAGDDTLDEIVTALQTQLGADYKVGKDSVGGDTKVVIENVATTGPTSQAPVVALGDAGRSYGSTSFAYDPARMGTDIVVDGENVTVGGDINQFAANLQTALGGSTGDYTVGVNSEDGTISVTSKIAGDAAPVIHSNNAKNASVTLSINSDTDTDVIAGVTIAGAATTATAVAGQLNANGAFSAAYTATVDAETDKLVITAKSSATSAATIAGLTYTDTGANGSFSGMSQIASSSNSVAAATGDSRTYTVTADIEDSTVFGVDLSTGGGGVTTAAGVAERLNANNAFAAAYTATVNDDGKLVVSTNAVGASANFNVVAGVGGQADVAGALTADGAIVQGQDAVTGATTAPVDGVVLSTTAAATQTFKVTYGNESVDVTIGAGTPEEIAESINDQLAAGGANAPKGLKLTATIDADGALQLEANSAEAKTLAISGANGTSLFGNNAVDVGEAATAPLNATKAVDKFVELINRDHGTSIRASNDNGRLRIENLSTAAMNVSTDKDGAGVEEATTSTIGGNTVREGLASQFNELKDQLNKLSDDASFNGINLLRGDQLTITFNETGNSFMQIKAASTGGINSESLNIEDLIGSDFDKDVDIDALLGDIKLALNSVRSQASAFGSNLSIVQNRQDFTKNMINTLETGAANLTLADMNEEAANLLALQTRQSLSSSALSMASQADQSVLQLLQ